MIEKLADITAEFILKNIPSEDEDMRDVYRYGAEITISSVLNIILILLLSAVFGSMTGGFVFLLCFISLRSFTGGYHAMSYLRCNTVFAVSYMLVCLSARLMLRFGAGTVSAAAIAALCFIPVILYAPVKNVHKKLTEQKRKRCRIISLALYTAYAAAGVLFIHADSIYGAYLLMTLAAVSCMIIAEIFMQKKGYHPAEE